MDKANPIIDVPSPASSPDPVDRIQVMSLNELMTFVTAMTAANDAYLSILNRPRCDDHSPCYAWLNEEYERTANLRGKAIAELERRPSDGGHDGEERIRIIAAYDLEMCGEGVVETMAKMARLYVEHTDMVGNLRLKAKLGAAA